MKIEQFERILEGIPGVRKDGAVFLVPEECELSVLVALPSEMVTVARVVRLERSADLSVLESQQGDRYHLPTECISIVKVAGSKRALGRNAGFR